MLRELALPPIAPQQIEHMVGKGSEHLLRSVLKHVLALDGKALKLLKLKRSYAQAWPSYQRHYLAINGDYARCTRRGAGLQALRQRGLRLACLTNKPTAFALPLLKAKGLDLFRAGVSGATRSSARSPTRCRCSKPARPWARRLRAR
jgi:phosphoglycolate phosphatase